MGKNGNPTYRIEELPFIVLLALSSTNEGKIMYQYQQKQSKQHPFITEWNLSIESTNNPFLKSFYYCTKMFIVMKKMQNFPFSSSTSITQPDIFEINVCDFYDSIHKIKEKNPLIIQYNEENFLLFSVLIFNFK